MQGFWFDRLIKLFKGIFLYSLYNPPIEVSSKEIEAKHASTKIVISVYRRKQKEVQAVQQYSNQQQYLLKTWILNLTLTSVTLTISKNKRDPSNDNNL